MSELLICCICLDPGGGPDFVDRAERCMKAQSGPDVRYFICETSNPKKTVGWWRNYAITALQNSPSVGYIAHFDWDDVSSPDRMAIQFAHIQKTGKLVTGFHTMPIYDALNDKVWIYSNPKPGYALGTSLFYKREAWERVKFPDRTPEDNLWRQKIGGENIDSISGFREDGSPIMIQTIHGRNASARIVKNSPYFKEASEAQEKAVREILARA